MSGRERKEHVLAPLKRLSYPDRWLFFDSESFVPKLDDWWLKNPSVPLHDEPVHKPRLICAEYWERTGEASYARADVDAKNQPIFRNDGAYREGDYANDGGPKGAPRYVGPERYDPDALCADFWSAVDRCATWTTHKKNASKLTVVAHNIGYDVLATGMYDHLSKLGWKLEHAYEKGPVYIQRGTKGKHIIELLSSTNFYVARLKAVGKDMGVEKMDFEDFNTENVTLLEEYCRQDVVVCREAMLRLVKTIERPGTMCPACGHAPHTNGASCASDDCACADGRETERPPLSPFKATISSIAAAAWRFGFMSNEVHIHTNALATSIERASYVGGRTEAWFIGVVTEPIYGTDENSLYGYQMRELKLPTELLAIRQMTTVAELKAALDADEFGYIAEVEVDMREAAVPFKSAQADKLLFPTGRFKTTLATPLLKLAYAHGTVLSVGRVCVYRVAHIFREYVDYMMERRKEAERAHRNAERQLYKNLIVNAYGKMGQLSEEWERIGDCPPGVAPHKEDNIDDKTKAHYYIEYLPSGVYRSTGIREEAFHAFPAVASFITSGGQATLWRVCHTANGTDGHHVYYLDTDSCDCDSVGYSRLVDAGLVNELKLGFLKLEFVSPLTTIRGAKFYDYYMPHKPHKTKDDAKEYCPMGWRFVDGKPVDDVPLTEPHYCHVVRRKGVPADAKLVVTPSGNFAAYQQFPKLSGQMQTGDVDHFRNRRVLKTLDVDYSKGLYDRSMGGWVTPFHLPEDAELAGLLPKLGHIGIKTLLVQTVVEREFVQAVQTVDWSYSNLELTLLQPMLTHGPRSKLKWYGAPSFDPSVPYVSTVHEKTERIETKRPTNKTALSDEE